MEVELMGHDISIWPWSQVTDAINITWDEELARRTATWTIDLPQRTDEHTGPLVAAAFGFAVDVQQPAAEPIEFQMGNEFAELSWQFEHETLGLVMSASNHSPWYVREFVDEFAVTARPIKSDAFCFGQ